MSCRVGAGPCVSRIEGLDAGELGVSKIDPLFPEFEEVQMEWSIVDIVDMVYDCLVDVDVDLSKQMKAEEYFVMRIALVQAFIDRFPVLEGLNRDELTNFFNYGGVPGEDSFFYVVDRATQKFLYLSRDFINHTMYRVLTSECFVAYGPILHKEGDKEYLLASPYESSLGICAFREDLFFTRMDELLSYTMQMYLASPKEDMEDILLKVIRLHIRELRDRAFGEVVGTNKQLDETIAGAIFREIYKTDLSRVIYSNSSINQLAIDLRFDQRRIIKLVTKFVFPVVLGEQTWFLV